jgi:hypothetical protein
MLMSIERDHAYNLADRASSQRGEDHQTDAIGEGLAVTAYAVLDLAAAIRELTRIQETKQ